jgi:hypothetical protein
MNIITVMFTAAFNKKLTLLWFIRMTFWARNQHARPWGKQDFVLGFKVHILRRYSVLACMWTAWTFCIHGFSVAVKCMGICWSIIHLEFSAEMLCLVFLLSLLFSWLLTVTLLSEIWGCVFLSHFHPVLLSECMIFREAILLVCFASELFFLWLPQIS